jgi:hypothetical protein
VDNPVAQIEKKWRNAPSGLSSLEKISYIENNVGKTKSNGWRLKFDGGREGGTNL